MILIAGAQGERVTALQQALKDRGFDPGEIDGVFGGGTEAALLSFQNSEGLLADGKAGAKTLGALGLEVLPDDHRGDASEQFTVQLVARLFPATPLENIKAHLPLVLAALQKVELGDRDMVLMALGTIRAETEGFVPISEFQSRYNTPPGGPPFSLYDNRKDLGNQGRFDGRNYRGRGFVQLTGRNNYKRIGEQIGIDLIENPDQANEAEIAAAILAQFLKNHEQKIREALLHNNLAAARKLVNGGSHGLAMFSATFQEGQRLTA